MILNDSLVWGELTEVGTIYTFGLLSLILLAMILRELRYIVFPVIALSKELTSLILDNEFAAGPSESIQARIHIDFVLLGFFAFLLLIGISLINLGIWVLKKGSTEEEVDRLEYISSFYIYRPLVSILGIGIITVLCRTIVLLFLICLLGLYHSAMRFLSCAFYHQ